MRINVRLTSKMPALFYFKKTNSTKIFISFISRLIFLLIGRELAVLGYFIFIMVIIWG